MMAWSCLLLGVGLDDLANRQTHPGVVFSVVVLAILIIGSIWMPLWRLSRGPDSSTGCAGQEVGIKSPTTAPGFSGS